MNIKRQILGFIIVAICAIAASLSTLAASPSEGIRGTGGALLSEVTDYAGNGNYGLEDGAVHAAQFRTPEGIVSDTNGVVYVADTENQLIRRVEGGEVNTWSGMTITVDPYGKPEGAFLDGAADDSFFQHPRGLAVDRQGNLYVADTDNHSIRKVDKNGTVTTLAGNGILGNADGTGDKASFYGPRGVAVDTDGVVYVADTLNHLIRKISPDGIVTTLNAPSERAVELIPGYMQTAGDYQDGDLTKAAFNEPTALALDAKGNLFVSDTGNQVIRYIDFTTNRVTTVAGAIQNPVYADGQLYAEGDFVDGKSTEARFHSPQGIAITKEGGLVIADSLNHAVRYLYEGEVVTLAGSSAGEPGATNGVNGQNTLYSPHGVTVLPDDRIVIADSFNNKLRQFTLYELPDSLSGPLSGHLPGDGQVHVVLNQELVHFDVLPQIRENRTMIPVRATGELLGYEVELNGETMSNRTITLTKGDRQVLLYVGETIVRVMDKGQETEVLLIDSVPFIQEGRTFVPVRFFAESLGLDVEWNQPTKTVILRDKTF